MLRAQDARLWSLPPRWPKASGRAGARRSAANAKPPTNPRTRARCRPVPPEAAAAQDPLPPPPPGGSASQPTAGSPGGSTTHQTAGAGSQTTPPASGGARLALRACGQVVTLAVALAALILWPAHLSGRLAAEPVRAAASYLLYLLFFASGTLSRMVRHGSLAPARADAQRSSGSARAALLLFAGVAVPAAHFAAFFEPTLRHAGPPGVAGPQGATKTAVAVAAAAGRALPWLGWALMLASWALKTAASAALGKDFNRLVAPERLVTTGPFSVVQHPIYTSYMMLFVGHCLSLGSPGAAAFILAACLLYYSVRTRLEEQLLAAAFGEQYQQYRGRTGRFLPHLL